MTSYRFPSKLKYAHAWAFLFVVCYVISELKKLNGYQLNINYYLILEKLMHFFMKPFGRTHRISPLCWLICIYFSADLSRAEECEGGERVLGVESTATPLEAGRARACTDLTLKLPQRGKQWEWYVAKMYKTGVFSSSWQIKEIFSIFLRKTVLFKTVLFKFNVKIFEKYPAVSETSPNS